jgi:ADP-glucose pyrophosphorylase
VKKVFLAGLFFFLVGCIKESRPPEGLIPKEKMISFLIDLLTRMNKDSIRAFFPEVEQRLFEKHGIDDSLYMISFNYYLQEVELMEEIYSAVVDSLSLRERLNEYSKE